MNFRADLTAQGRVEGKHKRPRSDFAQLGRDQSERDRTTDVTDHTDKRSEMPFIRGISEIRGYSFFGG
jgi:hypothetical protein